MIVHAIIGALVGAGVLVAGLVLLDIRGVILGLVLLLPSLYLIYFWFRKL